jgi:hypothetical protein
MILFCILEDLWVYLTGRRSNFDLFLSDRFILYRIEVRADLRFESGEIIDFSKLIEDVWKLYKWFYNKNTMSATIFASSFNHPSTIE